MSIVSPSDLCRNSTAAGDEFVDFEWLRVERLPARKGKKPAGQGGRPLRAARGVGQRAAAGRGARDLPGLALRGFEIAQHDHQQIVEIVGNAAAQLPDCVHFLGRGKLLLRLLQDALRLLPFGDVAGDLGKSDQRSWCRRRSRRSRPTPRTSCRPGGRASPRPRSALRPGLLERPLRHSGCAVLLRVEAAEMLADDFVGA